MKSSQPDDTKLQQCIAERLIIRQQFGVSTDDEATRFINRQRLESDVKATRPERKKFRWPQDYERLNKIQKGICGRCQEALPFIRGQVHIDHKDPNAPNFNADSNLQLTHKVCNLKKSSNSLYDEARKRGMTVLQLLQEQNRVK